MRPMTSRGSKARGVIRLSMNVRRLRRVPVLQPAPANAPSADPPLLAALTAHSCQVALRYLIAVHRPGVRAFNEG